MFNDEMLLEIPLNNLYDMMCASFSDLSRMNKSDLSGDAFDKVENMLSAIFVMGILRQFKRGLYKEYIPSEGLVPTMKGKIDIPETIRLKTQISRQVYCHYDEFSANNIYNQILKAFLLLILKRGRVGINQRKRVKQLMISFNDVSDISLGGVAWGKLSYEKNKFHYKMLINIGYMIYKNIHIDPETKRDYLDWNSIEQIYRQFVYTFFQEECKGIKVQHDKITSDDAIGGDFILKKEDRVMIMHTNLSKEVCNEEDLKSKKEFMLAEIKKMFYVVDEKTTLIGRMTGVLLYPSMSSSFVDKYEIEGYTIYMATFNLRSSIPEIKNDLRKISELI